MSIWYNCSECYGRNRYCPDRCFARVAPDRRVGQFHSECTKKAEHGPCPACNEHGQLWVDADDATPEQEAMMAAPSQTELLVLEAKRGVS